MTDLKKVFNEADAAGRKAAGVLQPTPMCISGYAPVMDGVCGFAWVNIKPGTSVAAKYAKENWRARKSYHGGVDIWISDYNQSMERKEAYANAFAKVLREAGINAYGMSRMD